MAKMICWGPSVGLPTTPLCVTPQLGVKTAYLSTAPLTNWRRKLVYELEQAKLRVFIEKLEYIKKDNVFVDVHQCIPEEILVFLKEAEGEGSTIYITIPLFNTPPRRYSSHIFMVPPYNLMITKCMFSSLFAMHLVTGMQVTDLTTDKCRCFLMINAPLKIVINNEEVTPCTICKHNNARVGKFCYLYNTNYACLFHAGDLPEFATDVGGEQLAALMNNEVDEELEETIDEIDKSYVERLKDRDLLMDNAWNTSEEGV